MSNVVLGLDIGGANLKAATADKRAVSVPFALWKQPDRLPAALAALVAQFPDTTELAVTMTGELCDCYETKRQGVNAILDAVESVANGRPVHVWGTDGNFATVADSRANYLTVAAANWHALATFTCRFAPQGNAILLDIGSTTTDVIPLSIESPISQGLTDSERLLSGELLYLGVRRTPVSAVISNHICSELFATTQDAYVVLGQLAADPSDTNTADGRPLTLEHSYSRLARMLGGDRSTISAIELNAFAARVHRKLLDRVTCALHAVTGNWDDMGEIQLLIVSGAGEFLGREAVETLFRGMFNVKIVSLNEVLGPTVSVCAPAYALAILATERP